VSTTSDIFISATDHNSYRMIEVITAAFRQKLSQGKLDQYLNKKVDVRAQLGDEVETLYSDISHALELFMVGPVRCDNLIVVLIGCSQGRETVPENIGETMLGVSECPCQWPTRSSNFVWAHGRQTVTSDGIATDRK